MFSFLGGIAIGLGAAAFALLGVLAGYNPVVTPEWEGAATALAILTAVLAAVATVALIGAMVYDSRRNRRRIQPVPSGRTESQRLYR